MAITAEQRVDRKRYIGSSDIAALLNLDPYRSAADVWLSKTGKVIDDTGSEATERGNLLEPAVLDWAEKKIGIFDRDIMAVHPGGTLAANFDGILSDRLCVAGEAPYIVEAKTTVMGEDWGEEGTDAVPDRVNVQVHHQMYVAGDKYRIAYVPVLMPGYRSFDFKMFRVDRNDDVCAAVAEAGWKFMEKHVRTDMPPDDFKPSMEFIKRIRRMPSKVVPIADSIGNEYLDACLQYDVAKKNKEDAQAKLLIALGDGEAGDCIAGRFTYLEQTRKAYEVKAATFRVLRHKKAK